MRNDLNKVLTERPRVGHKDKHKSVRKKYKDTFDINDEDGPLGGIEGMKKPYHDRKTPSDLWSCLRRWMGKQVGRPWNDVFSECCRDLSESDDMRAHFMAHVRIEVDEKLAIHTNGRLYRPRGPESLSYSFTWEDPDEIPGCNKRFYVDPRDGILKKSPERRWRGWKPKVEQPEHGWLMPDGVNIKYIEGIWYAVSMTVRVESYPYRRYDHATKTYTVIIQLRDVYDYSKRQLNSREMVRYGVTNSVK